MCVCGGGKGGSGDHRRRWVKRLSPGDTVENRAYPMMFLARRE